MVKLGERDDIELIAGQVLLFYLSEHLAISFLVLVLYGHRNMALSEHGKYIESLFIA